jgi:hypothetical protein
MQPPDCTGLSDLPDAALEVIFSFCATKDTVPSLCLVCQRWLDVYQKSSIPLPLLSLSGPLDCTWVVHHAKKLTKVGLLLLPATPPCCAARTHSSCPYLYNQFPRGQQKQRM